MVSVIRLQFVSLLSALFCESADSLVELVDIDMNYWTESAVWISFSICGPKHLHSPLRGRIIEIQGFGTYRWVIIERLIKRVSAGLSKIGVALMATYVCFCQKS